MPQVGIHSSGASYGVMAGWVKQHGGYVKFMSDFKDGHRGGYSTNSRDGLINGESVPYTGDEKSAMASITAGYIGKVAKPLYLYAGLGYGDRRLNWVRADNYEYVFVEDKSPMGLAVDLGAVLRIKKFSASLGVTTIGFSYTYLSLGVGVAF